jgi:hypothetical protein
MQKQLAQRLRHCMSNVVQAGLGELRMQLHTLAAAAVVHMRKLNCKHYLRAALPDAASDMASL